MEVRVAMLAPYKWRVGQVVWADSGEREYGIELYRPENFWGIYFLRKIGNWAFQQLLSRAQRRRLEQARPVLPCSLNHLRNPLKRRPCKYQMAGQSQSLRGIASNGLPFQERDLILPVGERDATHADRTDGRPGSKLQVIFSKNLRGKTPWLRLRRTAANMTAGESG